MKSGGEKEKYERKKAERYLENVDWFVNRAGVDMIPRDFITDFCCGGS